MHISDEVVNVGFRLWRDRRKIVHVSPPGKRTFCNRDTSFYDYVGTLGTPTCLECLAAR